MSAEESGVGPNFSMAPGEARSPATGHSPLEAARPPVQHRGLLSRLGRALIEEVDDLAPRLLLANALVSLLPTNSFLRMRTLIYRAAGLRIGPHSLVMGRIEFTGAAGNLRNLRIGAHSMINAHFFLDLNGEVDIGDYVSVGHHVSFITAEHELGPAYCRAGPLRSQPVRIGDGVWIGAGSTILPGVSIGKSSVVAAGSLVSGNVPDHRMVGGVPARPLKSLAPVP